MVKERSDSERKHPLPPLHKLLIYRRYTTDRIAHTTAFGKPIVAHWLELEIVGEKKRQRDGDFRDRL